MEAKDERRIVEDYYKRYQDGSDRCTRIGDARVLVIAGLGLLTAIALLAWRGYRAELVGAASWWTIALACEMVSHRFGAAAFNIAAKQIAEDGLDDTVHWGGWASTAAAALNICSTTFCACGLMYVFAFLWSMSP